ncbi:MAG: AIR synthase family protein [candidate division KSB1 bacterium]|nr:AIR synthase family protein [candidate division KSB1 bacterium]
MSAKPFCAGKLPADELARLLHKYRFADARVLAGPAIGMDAAAIRFDKRILLAKTDPITFASDEIGWYVLHVNANDIACMGGVPKWFLATLLLPENTTDADRVERIFADMAAACKQMGVSLVGGHTEITPGLDRPIVVGAMLGETSQDGLLNLADCQPNDRIILASGIGIEATSIIAREKEAELADMYDDEFVKRCKNFIHQPGISVLRVAREARRAVPVRAMHDPTEGGVATALHEVADACGCGLVIDEEAIPVLPESKLLCDQYNLDVLGVISSGALLIIVDEQHKHNLLKHFHEQKILAADIGYLTRNPGERLLRKEDYTRPLPRFDQDEIVKLFK